MTDMQRYWVTDVDLYDSTDDGSHQPEARFGVDYADIEVVLASDAEAAIAVAREDAIAAAAQRVEALRQASARSSTRSVRSEEAAISEHLPECPEADPSPARRSHCLCDRLRQAEQRGRDAYIKSLPVFHAYREGQRDERDRIRRFVLGLTTTEHTRHLVDTILWHIDKGDSDE
jgi:hypothetical protein